MEFVCRQALHLFTFVAHPESIDNAATKPDDTMASPAAGRPGPRFRWMQILQWIKKRGNIRSFKHCHLKASELRFDFSSFMKRMHPSYIAIMKSSDGQKVISLNDLPWADRWMIFYDLEIPHHRHGKRMK